MQHRWSNGPFGRPTFSLGPVWRRKENVGRGTEYFISPYRVVARKNGILAQLVSDESQPITRWLRPLTTKISRWSASFVRRAVHPESKRLCLLPLGRRPGPTKKRANTPESLRMLKWWRGELLRCLRFAPRVCGSERQPRRVL